MEERKKLLEVRHLKQYFGKSDFKAVDDVSFTIYKGEVFGLVGESGCGKTTTGRSIIHLYRITDGEIIFDGTRISAGTRGYTEAMARAKRESAAKIAELKRENRREEIRAEKERLAAYLAEQKHLIEAAKRDNKAADKENRDLVTQIQMIFQDPMSSLNPRMTVREIIAEGLRIRNVRDEKLIEEQVFRVLEMVGLVREHADRYPHEFSGGQRQRIGIARAIIMNPQLIIADEPVSALDVSIQAQVINLLNELREKMGLTILFIAHDLSVVKYFSDRIAVMYFGKIVEMADSDELFAHPCHPYTKSLLSAIPLPDPEYEKRRKRIIYDPAQAHDYSVEQPTLREVLPGHWVSCNTAEYEALSKELA